MNREPLLTNQSNGGDREIAEIREFFLFELEEKMEYQMIRRWDR